MNSKERFELILNDLGESKGYASQIHSEIQLWREEVYGEYAVNLDAKKKRYKSGIKLKDLERVIESSIPSIIEPFINDNDIVKAEVNNPDKVVKSKITEHLLNKQYREMKNREGKIEQLAHDLMVDGSVIVKTTLSGSIPTFEIINPFEIIVDPSAKRQEDIRFVIQRRVVSINDILSNPSWFGEHTLDELEELMPKTSTEYDDPDTQIFGRSDSFNFTDRKRQLVEVFEYNGMLPNESGELEPRLVIFSEDANMILNDMPSPYPAKWKGIPFDFEVYRRKSNSIFGLSIASLISDYQKVRTGFMRAIMENANSANHNQKWSKKGALDVVNKRKMMNGEDFETNVDPQVAIVQGEFNQIPGSVFEIMELMKQEEEEITGITRMGAGVNENALKSGVTATAVQAFNDTASRRLTFVVKRLSSLLSKVFKRFADLNSLYLEPVMMGNMIVDNTMICSENIMVVAPSAVEKQKQIQNTLFMMQQLQMLGSMLPMSIYLDLMTSLADNLDMPVLKQQLVQIKQNMNSPEAQQQQMNQQALQEQMTIAELNKTNMEAQKLEAEAVQKSIETQLKAYGL